ncbi:retrovirus-related pol polyprotein from transposon TNT 1-94 [Tanacetum coccineum]
MILELVENDPLIWPTVEENGVTRTKKYAELSATEKIQANYVMKATNIILQGLPADIYSLERECKLYDAFDKFTHIKGESLHKYYMRFTQLINDLNINNMKMEQFQVNTKFLNNLPPEWSKFVTDFKLVKDLHTTNFDQLHAYLEQHELYANEVRLLRERNQDLLAFVANQQMTPPHFNTHQSSYNNPQFQQQFPPSQYGSSHPTQYYSSTYPSQPQFNHSSIPPSYPYQSQMNHQTSSYNEKAMLAVKLKKLEQILDGCATSILIDPGNAKGSYYGKYFQTRFCWYLRRYLILKPFLMIWKIKECMELQDSLNKHPVVDVTDNDITSDSNSFVPHFETYLNDMENQSVHAMQDFEQTPVVDVTDNEITSDSNIISSREKMIDSQMDDMIKEKLALKEQVDSLEQNLSKQIKEKEYSGKCFTPQQELSTEQAFWLRISNPTIESSNKPPVIVEVPSELPKKELLLENDRLLQQIMSQDVLVTMMNSMSLNGESLNMERKRNESCDKCFNLDAELLKSQNAHNDLLKSYSQLEKHCCPDCSLVSGLQMFKTYDTELLLAHELLIVDDYSRFTWVRFLRTKDEAPDAIIKCTKNIQFRLNATVRNIRTDNGTKFVNQTLPEFYENVGISHQTSVARTTQQNSVVERQN